MRSRTCPFDRFFEFGEVRRVHGENSGVHLFIIQPLYALGFSMQAHHRLHRLETGQRLDELFIKAYRVADMG